MSNKIQINMVYFTTESKNTQHFIEHLDLPSRQITGLEGDFLKMDTPYILVFPTYGGGKVKGSVPKPVVDFIRDKDNLHYIIGIIGSGDRNYGEDYCLGARLLAEKLKVPLLYKYEIRGTKEDIKTIREGVLKIQESLNQNTTNLGE